MILYLMISPCFGDLIGFNRGINTIQQNNFQVLKKTANSPNSLRVLAELLKNDRLRARLDSTKMKTLNSFLQSQTKTQKSSLDSLEITVKVPTKDSKIRWRSGSRRKRNLLRKSFIRK